MEHMAVILSVEDSISLFLSPISIRVEQAMTGDLWRMLVMAEQPCGFPLQCFHHTPNIISKDRTVRTLWWFAVPELSFKITLTQLTLSCPSGLQSRVCFGFDSLSDLQGALQNVYLYTYTYAEWIDKIPLYSAEIYVDTSYFCWTNEIYCLYYKQLHWSSIFLLAP